MAEERAVGEMVSLDRLTKRFGPVQAVDAVSFEVGRGEVVGFLGPNGAGKTTTMRMITGFVSPSAGTARVCGFDVVERPLEVKRRIGYLPEGAPLYDDMTVAAFLSFIAGIRGYRGREKKRRLAAAVEKTSLSEVLHFPIETLSKGYKRRVGLAQAILHDPPVLILDEPTDGLDPNQKFEVRRLIREMAPHKAIVISTHILEEVDAVCSRAIVIARGRVVADDTPEGLRRRSPLHHALRIALPRERAEPFEQALRELADGAGLRRVAEKDGVVEYLLPPRDGTDLAALAEQAAQRSHATIVGRRVEEGRLDDVFRALTAAGDS